MGPSISRIVSGALLAVATLGLYVHLREAPLLSPGAPSGRGDPTHLKIETEVPLRIEGGKLSSVRAWPELNPRAAADRAWLLAYGPDRAASNEQWITFSFDDGPFPETTPEVLKLLRAYDIKATFFVVGQYLRGDSGRAVASRGVLRQIVAEGHHLGNHTVNHHRLNGMDLKEALAEIDTNTKIVEGITGVQPVFFRPPYGAMSPQLEHETANRGLELVLWNIEAGDMKRDDVDAMVAELRQQINYNRGGVVLLHDIRRPTVKVLKRVLDWVHKHRYDENHPEIPGYRVVDMPTYLRKTAEHPQPYSDRTKLERAYADEFNRRRVVEPKPQANPEIRPPFSALQGV